MFCCLQDFETRLYVSTEWITTKLESGKLADLMAACSRLADYCKRQSDAGMSGSKTECFTHTVLVL